jgi:pimeloyl-ACP methyl ester carboxylesterase
VPGPSTAPRSHLLDVAGVTIHALDWGGSEPALVCLPGITANAASFHGLADELAGERRVIALDLRGRGRSAVPPDGYDIGTHVVDVTGAMASLGIPSADVLGWSLGAKVALGIGALRPEAVRRLIVVDPPLEASPQTIETLRGFWARLEGTYASVDEFLDRMRGAPLLPAWDGYVEAYLRADVREDADGVVRHRVAPWVPLRELENQGRYRTADLVAAVRAPTLILRSTLPMLRDGDAVLTREDAEWLAAHIPDATLVDVDGTTHFSIMLGRHPATMAAIRSFLASAVPA